MAFSFLSLAVGHPETMWIGFGVPGRNVPSTSDGPGASPVALAPHTLKFNLPKLGG